MGGGGWVSGSWVQRQFLSYKVLRTSRREDCKDTVWPGSSLSIGPYPPTVQWINEMPCFRFRVRSGDEPGKGLCSPLSLLPASAQRVLPRREDESSLPRSRTCFSGNEINTSVFVSSLPLVREEPSRRRGIASNYGQLVSPPTLKGRRQLGAVTGARVLPRPQTPRSKILKKPPQVAVFGGVLPSNTWIYSFFD